VADNHHAPPVLVAGFQKIFHKLFGFVFWMSQ
jgi:hypothetical protein